MSVPSGAFGPLDGVRSWFAVAIVGVGGVRHTWPTMATASIIKSAVPGPYAFRDAWRAGLDSRADTAAQASPDVTRRV